MSGNTAVPAADDDALASLEEKIRRAAELVVQLRAERDAAVAERDAARNAAGTTLSDMQHLRNELESMRSDRKNVRARIEKLLGQLDQL